MGNQNDSMVLNAAKLGIEAESFERSLFGKYLFGRADELIEIETNRLIHCGPSDIECNTEARNGIQIGALFKQWVEDAIQEGQMAQQLINEEDATS